MEETEYCPVINPIKGELETRKNRLEISMHLDIGDQGKFYAEYQSRHFPGVTDKSQPGYICQDGWDRYLNFCYQMISAESEVTWHEAEEACKDKGEGSHLVSIKGTGGMDFVHHKLTSGWLLEEEYNWVYIGLKRIDDEGKFRWSDGSPMSFTSWYRSFVFSTSNEVHSQPDGSELEECTMIIMTRVNSVAQWHDVTCSRPSTRHYICKQPAVNNVTGEVFHTDNYTVVYNKPDEDTSCPPSLYMCTDGEYYIQRIFVCDGIDHCYDGSDELDCKAHDDDECPKDFFRCTEGQCISTSFLCDNINHCEDNSDELGCHYAPCREDEVPCEFDRNICIASTKICDLIQDCPYETDETDCDEEPSLFPCYSGRMLPKSAVCDGMVDCIGSSYEDELKCDYNEPNYTCDPETELQCDNGKCVDLKTKCLYDVDRLGFIIGCRDVSHLQDCSDFVCPPYTFGCPLSYCIPLRMRCNGIKDCPNGQDELECDQDQYKCPNSSYACQQRSVEAIEGQRICLAPDQICDGQTQCPQGDDELYCDFTCPINCTCFGLSVTCERPSWKSHNPPVLHRDIRVLRISDVQLVLEPTDEGTLYRNDNRTESDEDEPISISLTNLPYLAELELTSTGIKRLTPSVFLNNTNLYKMNLSGNELDDIAAGALYPLKSLRNLDITNTSVDAGPKNKDLFLGVNNTLTELHADNFVFCCLLDPNVECQTEKDRFSSCDNLLNNELLRILMWVLGISALIGNTFVVSYRILQRKRVENSQVQSHLISNLAVSDLMMGVYMMIIAAKDENYRGHYYLHSESWRSSVLCKTAGFLSMLSSEVSVFLVMIISLDRLFCVVFPFRQRLHLTPHKALVLIVATWIFSFLLSLVPLLVPDYAGHFYGQSSVCLAIPLTPETEPGWEYSVFIFLGINFFSFMVTLICYVVIFAEVYRSSARMAGRKQQTSHSRRLNSQIKLASKMALIVGTDFCCWMPVIIMGILAKTGAAEIPADMYAWSAVVLLPINSAINPYLYTLSSLRQRRKQRLRTKALATNMSMQDVNTKTEISVDDNLDNSSSEEPCQVNINPLYASLAKHCILTPFTHFGRTTHIQTLTEYINQRGTMPSMVDSALIRRDISKALSYLKSKGVVDMEPGEEKIAVQLSSGGDVRQAFFVVYNAKDVQRLLQPNSKSSNLNNHLSDQREYVKTMLEDLREKDENLKPKDDNLKASKVGY
ncbi:G-protein coupled receptor GRL101-like [Lytechinus pictus]|uniref:G-protein coupled receptor GRL101-like n=1 Tax=Lytechinus pictus TaxID=7653 RepID=UPI0030BA1BEC